jgi:hypothetical protein
MGWSPSYCSSLGKASDLVFFLMMIMTSIGFSHPAKVSPKDQFSACLILSFGAYLLEYVSGANSQFLFFVLCLCVISSVGPI